MRVRGILAASFIVIAACGGAAPSAGTSATDPAARAATVAIVVQGVLWELPPEACGGARADLTAAAASAATEVERLVADRVSGWPTTTVASPGDAAAFFVAVNRAGPRALALALLAGSETEVTGAWAAFEETYAGTDWDAVDVIAIRLPGWRATAAAITDALPAACG